MPNERQLVDYRELIPDVRQYILDRNKQDPEIYDPIDVERVERDEWSTLRFIKWNRGDVGKARTQLDTCLKWRQEFGINRRTVADVPVEFTKAGAIFTAGTDMAGRRVLYLRAKVYRRIPALVDYFKQFVVGLLDLVDKDAGASGYSLVFDLTGLGFSNADMDFLQFLINTFRNYFPYGLRHVTVYSLPRLLRPLWAVARLWIGSEQEKLIKFVYSVDELRAIIPVDQLPCYLGGQLDTDFTEAPPGCKSVKELAPQYGFTDKEVDKYIKIFEPHLLEAKQLVTIGAK
ncbi:motile sperm domain-containing protein 2-like [Oppia nitens]|uniref:motile sperm domain-containing protein 2-like n=1 Tax=Oppia nitens TaxID=1686743 RepID=UPI0023DB3F24|nr:motile sperm domain-containing protein 2-like [Oppia nitens]